MADLTYPSGMKAKDILTLIARATVKSKPYRTGERHRSTNCHGHVIEFSIFDRETMEDRRENGDFVLWSTRDDVTREFLAKFARMPGAVVTQEDDLRHQFSLLAPIVVTRVWLGPDAPVPSEIERQVELAKHCGVRPTSPYVRRLLTSRSRAA